MMQTIEDLTLAAIKATATLGVLLGFIAFVAFLFRTLGSGAYFALIGIVAFAFLTWVFYPSKSRGFDGMA